MDKVLTMVKQQCLAHGVRFYMPRNPIDFAGSFCSDTKTLTVGRNYEDASSIRIRSNKLVDMHVTALHELVHMWQWARKDANWVAMYDEHTTLSDLVMDYSEGQKSYPLKALKDSAKCLMALEWEAERTSLILADSLGVSYDRARYLRGAKAYVYGYYVAAVTGYYINRKIRRLWSRIMVPNYEYDLTKELLKQMIHIVEKNPQYIEAAWVNGVWTPMGKYK